MHQSNQPNRAPVYLNYREALSGLANQGFRAFFKGAHPLLLSIFVPNSFKIILFSYFEYFHQFRQKNLSLKSQFAFYFYTSTAIGKRLGLFRAPRVTADLIFQPVQVIYSTQVISDNRPKFQIYKSFGNLLRSLKEKEKFFKGSSVIFIHNFLLSLSLVFCHPTEPNRNVPLRFALLR